MGALVFRSGGGRKYHADRKCPALARGQALWDRRHLDLGDDDYCTPLDVWGSTPDYSAGCGRLPCLACVPPGLRVFPPLYGETFGHRAVAVSRIDSPYICFSRCQSCRRGRTDLVCARCMEFDANGMWIIRTHPVHWPCTSVIVLGLVPRTEAAP